jgi:hypothetical protein
LSIAPKKQTGLEIILQKPSDTPHYRAEPVERLEPFIGSIPWWIFEVDDCRKTFEELSNKGVIVEGKPKQQPWGTSVNFEDLYGNKFMLLEPSSEEQS